MLLNSFNRWFALVNIIQHKPRGFQVVQVMEYTGKHQGKPNFWLFSNKFSIISDWKPSLLCSAGKVAFYFVRNFIVGMSQVTSQFAKKGVCSGLSKAICIALNSVKM